MIVQVLVIPVLLQLVLPLALCALLAFWRPTNLVTWLFAVTATAAYIFAIGIAGLWLALPPQVPWVLAALLVVVVARRAWRRRALPLLPRRAAGWGGLAAASVAMLLAVGVCSFAVSGRRMPDGHVVQLALPLGPGTHLVLNGGSNALVNAHYKTLGAEPRFQQYRGQSHGVDITTLNRWGVRAAGVLPRDPTAYFAFGQPVLAPCSGAVVRAVDGLPDLSPPDIDRVNMAGNHVILSCGGAWVVLAHLRNGSVRVSGDDSVSTGQRLGDVGNSGNTAEPHLHVHAQTPGSADAPLDGAPLHLRFDGRFPVRNQRVTHHKR